MDLAEGLDPEAWAQIMDQFFTLLSEGVRRFGGTVDKFTGDGIMALFGAPVAQEDHARRAGHAALEITSVVAAYAAELRRTHGLTFHVRVGLNSGEVVAARLGDAASTEYTAVGHTVGLAQRMEALAEPGCAYLSEHTAKLVSGQFRLRDLGPVPVRGASEPVRVFALDGAGPRRQGVARWPGRSPLVGRAEEMATLEAALDRAEAGQAQVVGVVGEPGVGKSRLCEEFVRSATGRGITVRRAAGVSHATGIPLLPVLELLRDYFGITDADTPRTGREKVAGRLLLLDAAFADDLPLLFDFLELPDPDRPPPRLSAEVRNKAVHEIVQRLSQRRSEQETLVLLLEDLHWFDADSEAFIAELIRSYPGTRTLVVANFRPEFQASWMRHSYYRQLPLAPLDEVEVRALLGALLGDDRSLGPLADHVIGGTGGNPFFVEEVVRALVEDGSLAGEPGAYRLTRPLTEVGVPATVQATLSARIDRLPEREKQVLQTAAVIGRTFPQAVLAAVAERADEDLDAALTALCEAEFLQQEAAWPAPEYRFWHALTRDVAYGTLLSARRARLHAGVAQALADLDPARQDERAALVATHYAAAGSPLEAARWEYRAARWALRRDVEDAVRRWRKVLEQLGSGTETDDALALGAQARIRLAQFGIRAGMGSEEAEGLLGEAKRLAERLGDRALTAVVVQVHGTADIARGELASALGRTLEGVGLADETHDVALRATTRFSVATFSVWTGPIAPALRLADEAFGLLEGRADLGVDRLGYSPLVGLYRSCAVLLGLAGRMGEALRFWERAAAESRERGETETLAWSLAVRALLEDWTGERGEALASAREARQIGETSGNRVVQLVAALGLGGALVGAERHEEAVDVLSATRAAMANGQLPRFEEASVLATLARAELGEGNVDAAIGTAAEAVEVARRQGARVLECLALLTRAQVARATGAGDARADLATGLALAADVGAVTYAAFLLEERARLDGNEAALKECIARYQDIEAGGHARRLTAELSAP
jgi:adenylate cyclase